MNFPQNSATKLVERLQNFFEGILTIYHWSDRPMIPMNIFKYLFDVKDLYIFVSLEYRAELYSRLESKRKKSESQKKVEQLTQPSKTKVNPLRVLSLKAKPDRIWCNSPLGRIFTLAVRHVRVHAYRVSALCLIKQRIEMLHARVVTNISWSHDKIERHHLFTSISTNLSCILDKPLWMRKNVASVILENVSSWR